MKIFSALFLVTILMASQSFAGDFRRTCKTISLHGPDLVAVCQKTDGRRWSNTRLNLNLGIGSRGGALVWGDNNFTRECKGLSLDLPPITSFDQKAIMRAECIAKRSQSGAAEYRKTELNLTERISNNNGRLEFDR